MGYRHYLGIINKEKLEELKNKKYDDCFLFQNEVQDNCRAIFELGKLYTDNETTDVLYEECEKLIDDCDIECFIPNQKIFLTLANVYKEKVYRHFTSINDKIGKKFDINNIEDEQKKAIYELIQGCREKIGYLEMLKFSENAKDVELTWFYEHQMFNLMHYYLITDYAKEVVVCFAY